MKKLLFVAALLAAFCSKAFDQTTREQFLATQAPLLEAYRASDGYLQEPWRPRVHFTPERNWMNDPNGLVHHRGEYHLFYQHNPLGNDWGHMSWGHAVSDDLVHWRHLPIAIWEEGDEMIFSGCCVVDEENTSGFGAADEPAMVAVYTSHRPGNQSQSLAYSTDRGRTWTKHAGNPVIDLGKNEFRDPKVFWHEATGRWVMVVALSADRKVQFYGSPNLKEWELLSEFGPAGAEPKLNWECPDLFELAIEDAHGEPTGETAWVLESDMGGGGPGGGAGCEYFVGDFDGERFTCSDPENRSRWLAHGDEFYAAVTWANLPEGDGRQIWLGWMHNFATGQKPTSPWRSCLSVPRELTLRRVDGELRLIQRPVRELETLRGESVDATQEKVRGKALDIELVVEPSGDEPVELRVLAGGDEATVIGYDPAAEELYFDQTRAGESGLSDAFAAVHRAPLPLGDEPLRLRVLVDHSTVEVFAQDGLVVFSELVFPSPESDAVRLDAPGSQVKRFVVWPLKSALPGKN